jgi:predicted dehydrogenase
MTRDDRLRAAIIGAGLMGGWHADAVERIGGRVAVIVDPNGKARETLGQRYPQARLLAELNLDEIARHATAAHVCTPESTHEAIARELIAAGLHLLVEKPFAKTTALTESLLSLAAARGVVACPVHQFAFQEGFQQLVGWLPALGTLRRVAFSTCSAGAAGDDALSLNGLVAEILPHPFALVPILIGGPVAGAAWQVQTPAPGELFAATTIDGVVVTIAISAHGRPTENVLRVVGDRGSAAADLFHGFAVRQAGSVSRRAKIAHPFAESAATFVSASSNLVRRALSREPAYPGLRELIRRFYAATRGESEAPISPASTVDVAKARDELLACLAERSTV